MPSRVRKLNILINLKKKVLKVFIFIPQQKDIKNLGQNEKMFMLK